MITEDISRQTDKSQVDVALAVKDIRGKERRSKRNVMFIHIESNFIIPGLEGESIEVAEGTTLRQFLAEISRISDNRLEFFRNGTNTVDLEDWKVSIKDASQIENNIQPETPLKDGDIVVIRISIIGGG